MSNMVLTPTFEETKIEVPWGYIQGKWWGNHTQMPLIAIHGWQDNSGTFDNLAPLLVSEGFSVLAIDLPGHGLSSHLPDGVPYYIFWNGLVTLRRIVQHFSWENIKVIGHSLGGIIAFLYASSFPDDIDCFISLDISSPAVRTIPKIVDAIGPAVDTFLKYETHSKTNNSSLNYAEMIDIVEHAHKGNLTRNSCEIMMERGMRADENGSLMFTRDPRLKVGVMGMIDIHMALEMAQRIKCKVLNIRGNPGMTLDNPTYYSDVLDAIEKNAKSLKRVTVDGTHHVHLNNANSVMPHIAEFLLGSVESD